MTTEVSISQLALSDATAVDELMKRNSQTLGFLPRRALDEYLRHRTAIGAKAPSGQLAGYLLYAANPFRFRLVHLCVDDAFRGQRIARRLVDALRGAATTQTGIRLHCRRDYSANDMWPSLGFLPLGEKPARAPGRRLTLWYLDLTPEDRLGLFRARTSDETVDIVVDSQVFFDLHEPDNDTTRVSKSLLSDFMADSVRIVLTDEIYPEIDRNQDPNQRELSRQHARGFPTIEYDPRSVDHFVAVLAKLLPDRTRSQKSDIRHLAKTTASQVRTFVTRDEKLLNESLRISTLTGLQVVTPADVIIRHHELLERQFYGPSRVAGVDLAWRRWAHDDSSSFPFDLFLNDGERKGNFKTKLNRFLADPKLSPVEILYRENDVIAIRVLGRDSSHGLIARMVRIARTVDQRQFGRFVAADLLAEAAEKNLCMVRVDSRSMTSGLSHGLMETGFTKYGDDFVRFSFSTCFDRPTTLEAIGELSPASLGTYHDLTDLDLEGHCSPLSLRGTCQTYFVVPVRPAYAMSLFDRRQSAGDFFGGEAEILLRWQNVYYRKKTHHRMIKPPGRILWYVSGPEKQIVAVSRLDDVAVDTPKILFGKFQKFGILKWPDLYEMCDGEVTTEIMALLFSHSFLFREPISLPTMSSEIPSFYHVNKRQKRGQSSRIHTWRVPKFGLESCRMHPHEIHSASSDQRLQRRDLLGFIDTLYDGDLHAKRVLSLANATLGVLVSASLAIHAVGRGLAQAMGTLTKHGVKQVDRLLSNRGVDVWTFFEYWTPYIVGARTEVVVVLDWTSFAADGQDTIVLSMVTGHGRATPLLWKTVASSTLKGNQRRIEYELLARLREVLPDGVKVTVLADRGFADCKLFYALATELGFEYVIRLRGDVYVTNARGERRLAAGWVGAGGRARRLVGARVTDVHEFEVGVVVCVHDRKMDEPWCLVASDATIPTRVLIRYYGKRWGIEAGFRDIKDMRFGMGLSSMHVARPERRDRLLLISALAIAVLSLLGAAGECIGYDRWLKANTVKRRTHSLFRQGLMLYNHLPNWPDDRIRPLMEKFGSMLAEQRVFKEIFGVI